METLTKILAPIIFALMLLGCADKVFKEYGPPHREILFVLDHPLETFIVVWLLAIALLYVNSLDYPA